MCWGARTHTLRLQGKGTHRSWGSTGESMGGALPAFPWGLPLSGVRVFPGYFPVFTTPFRQVENSCPCGAPGPKGKAHLKRILALSRVHRRSRTLHTGPPLARAPTLGRVLRYVLLRGFPGLREAGALCPESPVEG